MKIKTNDNVIVLTGKDRGKKSTVTKALPRDGKVIVEGVNIKKIRQKSRQKGSEGGILEKNMPIDVSNVALVDPKTNKPSRVGYVLKTNGKEKNKQRISKKSGQEIK